MLELVSLGLFQIGKSFWPGIPGSGRASHQAGQNDTAADSIAHRDNAMKNNPSKS